MGMELGALGWWTGGASGNVVVGPSWLVELATRRFQSRALLTVWSVFAFSLTSAPPSMSRCSSDRLLSISAEMRGVIWEGDKCCAQAYW